MNKYLFFFFIGVGVHGWGQVDTLELDNRRAIADIVFGALNPQLYDHILIDRSVSFNPIVNNQLKDIYTDTISGPEWLDVYSDLAISYTDSTKLFNDSAVLAKLYAFEDTIELTTIEDELIQPFGLLLHNVTLIDSNFYLNNDFTNVNSQLVLNSSINESSIYRKKMIKAGAILEFYGDHGYESGKLKYDNNYLSFSPDIQLENLQLDLGNGYQEFSERNSVLSYDIKGDFTVGKAAVSYYLNNSLQFDTLTFFISTITYKYLNQEKSVDRWDTGNQNFPSSGEPDLKYRIKFGCGNGRKIRRPVIIAPPYRPNLQPVSFNKYYDQFDFKSLLSSLSDMGYDVLFIKETPGNRGIDHAGGNLASFLREINVQKKQNYPNEDWENIAIGFSAGGQHWRYALKKLEKEHMETGTPHHHTRLYIPFDSPHWGANIPMFTQTVYSHLRHSNFWALNAYNSLTDAASKDMAINHILGGTSSTNNHVTQIYPGPTSERQAIVNQLENNFNHQFSHLTDLRRTFPSFTRNVAISTGKNDQNYTSQYTLGNGMKLFEQDFTTLSAFFGIAKRKRSIYSSQYSGNPTVFKRNDLTMVGFLIPVIVRHEFRSNGLYEWDEAQGGYKDDFYDGYAVNFLGTGIIPIGAISILRNSVNLTAGGTLFGTKYYKKHINFLPMLSSLAINPTIWQNNNLYYDLKNEGLMYQTQQDIVNQNKSDIYGYPNLAHPINHFTITPFEAIYCDPQTYQHIKMQESVSDDGLDGNYLVYTRNFILDEVESDVVFLQNKIIGKNHLQWDPTYRYKAWYKAYDKIVIGYSVTPKTDLGDYTIEKTGEITVYACKEINIKPGFRSENGSVFHAYIQCDGCSRPREEKSGLAANQAQRAGSSESRVPFNEKTTSLPSVNQEQELSVFPNPSAGELTIVFPKATGKYVISDSKGVTVLENEVNLNTQRTTLRLPKGIYIVHWYTETQHVEQKMSVL